MRIRKGEDEGYYSQSEPALPSQLWDRPVGSQPHPGPGQVKPVPGFEDPCQALPNSSVLSFLQLGSGSGTDWGPWLPHEDNGERMSPEMEGLGCWGHHAWKMFLALT